MIVGWTTQRPLTCPYCAGHECAHPEGGWCVTFDGREFVACESHALDAFDAAVQAARR